eukprot:TRINITY_DN15233_c0_g1_i1.p1 TRINITY_DN15233_c0_g1~~TRINITY_DN15233_c0_g1_i1.p1  ORF type:complete len:598 (-),score=166.88 TRINITY_DN15233_c0_g1_i1:33-1655(-)
METGAIVSWQKKVGDAIAPGDVIAEVETDKAKIAFETTDEGYIAKFLVEEGTTGIPVGKVVVIVVENKEDIAKFADYNPEDATPAPAAQEQPKQEAAPSSKSFPPHIILALPALSPTMETGKIVSWTRSIGDVIQPGDAIAEIETDKATITFESTDDGYLAKILVDAGGQVPVGSPIAVVSTNKGDVPLFADYTLSEASSTPATSASASSPEQTQAQPQTTSSSSVEKQSAPVTRDASERIFVSPKARAAAKEKGYDLSQIRGTGPNGRIIYADVAEFVPAKAAAPVQETAKVATPAVSPVAPTLSGAFTDIPASNIRKIIAERLSVSKQTIPHYYLTVECNVEKLSALRTQLNEMGKGDYKLSVNDFVIKAAAIALKEVPEVNSEWCDTHIRQYHNVDINVAVNSDKGLLTPIVRDCDKIGLAAISNTVKAVAGRAQAGASTLEDLQMGTFTISNLGMFGIKQFCAVINPPQGAILAVGGIDQKPVLVTRDPEQTPKFTTVSTLTVTLSCDHRVVDGAVGAKWLQVFKDVIENPMKFLL